MRTIAAWGQTHIVSVENEFATTNKFALTSSTQLSGTTSANFFAIPTCCEKNTNTDWHHRLNHLPITKPLRSRSNIHSAPSIA